MMKKEPKEKRPGENVEETGEYYCDICHTEGGRHELHLVVGEKFPQCPNCGDDGKWQKK